MEWWVIGLIVFAILVVIVLYVWSYPETPQLVTKGVRNTLGMVPEKSSDMKKNTENDFKMSYTFTIPDSLGGGTIIPLVDARVGKYKGSAIYRTTKDKTVYWEVPEANMVVFPSIQLVISRPDENSAWAMGKWSNGGK